MKGILRAGNSPDAYQRYLARYSDRRAPNWIGMFSYPVAAALLLAVPPLRNLSTAIAMVVPFVVRFLVLTHQQDQISLEIADIARTGSEQDLPLLLRLMDLKYCESIKEIGEGLVRIVASMSPASYAALSAEERAMFIDIVSRCLDSTRRGQYSPDLCAAVAEMLGRLGSRETGRRLAELDASTAPEFVRHAIRAAVGALTSVTRQ